MIESIPNSVLLTNKAFYPFGNNSLGKNKIKNKK